MHRVEQLHEEEAIALRALVEVVDLLLRVAARGVEVDEARCLLLRKGVDIVHVEQLVTYGVVEHLLGVRLQNVAARADDRDVRAAQAVQQHRKEVGAVVVDPVDVLQK